MGVDALFTYKNHFMVNEKIMIVSLDLVKGMSCNNIFSWPFLQKIKASIMTENNTLVSGLLGEQFKMEMMVPQISKEAEKISERLPV